MVQKTGYGKETLISETSKYYIYTSNMQKCEGKPIDSSIWKLIPDSLKVGKYWTGIVWTDDNGWSGNYGYKTADGGSLNNTIVSYVSGGSLQTNYSPKFPIRPYVSISLEELNNILK